MNAKLIQFFQSEVSKAFAFVTITHNFVGPYLEVDEHIAFATVIFKGRNLAIQLILDERDENITCKIARVFDGNVTKHYARDESGNIVRDSLFSIIIRKGIRGKLFTQKTQKLSLEEQIPVMLEDFARMLKEHGAEILDDSPMALSVKK